MFENPFSFDGRIRRTEFGLSFIIYFAAYAIIAGIISAAESSDALIFLSLAYIPLLWFLWAQGAKRCHDVGNSGWWQLIPFYVFWLIFQDGEPGQNQYGANPKLVQQNNNYNPPINTQSQSSNSTSGGYNSGHYDGGHNSSNAQGNSQNLSSNSDNSANSSGEYKSGDLYK